jgi:hypothetical protein
MITGHTKADILGDDPVARPRHYVAGGVEVIDFIEAKQLNFHLGNVVKYVSRAGIKSHDPLQDIRKAAWYLNRYLEQLEREAGYK